MAVAVWRRLDAPIRVLSILPDGSKLRPADPASGREGDVIAEIEGDTASILKGERTAINFLQHLSGVATETNRFVRAVEGLPARIVDTRKTVPGLRASSRSTLSGSGGGGNHRINLGDGVLIKDNHIEALRAEGAGLAEAVRRARVRHTLRVEVEVETLHQVSEALEAGADILLLDNMTRGRRWPRPWPWSMAGLSRRRRATLASTTSAPSPRRGSTSFLLGGSPIPRGLSTSAWTWPGNARSGSKPGSQS